MTLVKCRRRYSTGRSHARDDGLPRWLPAMTSRYGLPQRGPAQPVSVVYLGVGFEQLPDDLDVAVVGCAKKPCAVVAIGAVSVGVLVGAFVAALDGGKAVGLTGIAVQVAGGKVGVAWDFDLRSPVTRTSSFACDQGRPNARVWPCALGSAYSEQIPPHSPTSRLWRVARAQH